ncbi:MAG: archaeosine biosynthesis radical SAM protein RaSEA [Pseudomonadota bacterium]
MIPSRTVKTDQIGDYELRHGFLNNKKIRRLIVYMRSSGCQWMLDDEKGGCFMCGHIAGTTQGEPISAENYIDQFTKIMDQFDFHDIPMLCVYNAGSFFNDKEVPRKARYEIYKRINKIDGIKQIIFESRPEYICAEELQLIQDTIDKRIEIGIGLESSNEKIRQVCLNKGFSLDEYLRAIEICKKHNVSCLAYVLLKPLFLNEQNAINDAVNSIKWAFEKGIDVISIEPVSVQKGTLVHLLYNKGFFRPPWIWSVLNVVRESHTEENVIRIGGFEFFPPPSVCVHNCPSCNEYLIDEIEKYNTTNNISSINSVFDMNCRTCKHKWMEEMKDTTTIEDNIDNFLAAYDDKDLEKYIRNDLRSYPNNILRIGACGSSNV